MKSLQFSLVCSLLFFISVVSAQKIHTTGAIACESVKSMNGGDLTPTGLDIDTLESSVPMMHVGGGIHTTADFTYIKGKLAANEEPWVSGWKKLISNHHAQETYLPNPTEKLVRGGNTIWEQDTDNYGKAMNDVAAAYQLALRWRISGEEKYAQASIKILNAWSSTCKSINGDSNMSLAAGIYGYQFAIAGELMRDYPGWTKDEFKAYHQWMIDVFYVSNLDFLVRRHGTCAEHYWANWDLCNLASVLAIGILADRRDIYNVAIAYLQEGVGNGNLNKTINFVHIVDGEKIGQLQESGRDQGHSTMVIALLSVIGELTYNQGDDFYGYKDNLILRGSEYTAKYNVALQDVPFENYTYIPCNGINPKPENEWWYQTEVSSHSRGVERPMWCAIYNHYAKVKKISENETKYTKMGVNYSGVEGGGGDYGQNSGGFDQLGFGTLMYTLD